MMLRRGASALARRAMSSTTKPSRIVDAHHHFYDPPGKHFNALLNSLGVPAYMPEAYAAESAALPVTHSVHIEAIADDSVAEVEWVASLVSEGRCKVGAIVAACNLSVASDAELAPQQAELARIASASPLVRGIRQILDYDGPFNGGQNATHVACSVPGRDFDFLRDPEACARFERGLALLPEHGFSFDLQCAPAQLEAAARLFARHPGVPVVIDHMGKPRHLRADRGAADAAELAIWRQGMAAMAALPHAHVKLSMLGYAVPGWSEDAAKEAFLRDLVLETVGLFGASRCMFASNWHGGGAFSNSDLADECDISMHRLFDSFASWVAHLPEGDRELLFAGSAGRFYRLEAA